MFGHLAAEVLPERAYHVAFADELTYAGDVWIHVSVQDVTVGARGRIVEIRDVTEPDEQAKVEAFLVRHGLRR